MSNWITSIRLPIEYKDKLNQVMEKHNRPMVWIIKKALDSYLAHELKQPKPAKTTTKTTTTDRIPYQNIVNLYHEMLPELPRIKELTPKRRSQIAARWKSGQLPDIYTWTRFFNYIRKSDWLMGRCDPAPGRKRFVANLEWITKESNYANIIERKYHN